MKIKHVILLVFALPILASAQDLTGTWVGSSGMAYVKLVVIHKGDSLLGYTYDEGPGWCQATFLGIYDSKKKHLKGKGVNMLRQSGNHALAVYQMDYFKSDGHEMLNGTVQLKSALFEFFSLSRASQIFLRKEKNEVDTVPFMQPFLEKKDNLPVIVTTKGDTIAKRYDSLPVKPIQQVHQPSIREEKKARISKLVEHIYTDADSINIAVYDNGEVDQDSVTIFFDDAIILDRYMISDKAKELSVIISKDGREHSLELFAHNLGNIPPNTALIIITAGKKRYELHASYDLTTNARIIISHTH